MEPRSTIRNVQNMKIDNIKCAAHIKQKNIRHLFDVLRCMGCMGNNTEIQLTAGGMIYVSEESQYFQALAFFKCSFFDYYKYKLPEPTPLGINLAKVTEIIGSFIDNDFSFLKIVWFGEEMPLAFKLCQKDSYHDTPADRTGGIDSVVNEDDENLLVTEYVIHAKESIDPIDYSNKISQSSGSYLVLKAAILYDALQDVDSRSMDEIAIIIKKTHMTFQTIGITQRTTSIRLNFQSDFYYKKDVVQETKFHYKFNCMKIIIKSLPFASKVLFQTHSENGLLQCQLMMPSAEKENDVFLEFYISASINDDSDQENCVDE